MKTVTVVLFVLLASCVCPVSYLFGQSRPAESIDVAAYGVTIDNQIGDKAILSENEPAPQTAI